MHFRSLLLAAVCTLMTACASTTIVPTYNTTNPNIQVGGDSPEDQPPEVENAGSFCLQISDKWHEDGKTPDGTKLYSKDTFRKVVPCE